MTKDEILSEIRRLGKQRGGRLSFRSFCSATGIPEKQILGTHWPTWNDAIVDAGLSPQSFLRPRADERAVLEALAQLIQRLGHWPTENELSIERHSSASFPSLHVIRRLNRAETLSRRLLRHCAERSDLEEAAKIVLHRLESEPVDSSPARMSAQGYVYMMRSGRRYKIGHTNSPTRRHREIRLDLPAPTDLVHSIMTDDPTGIEAYWHNRFRDKRVRDTEFFALDASDVAAFKRRRFQ
jgi:Meiotically up-regulated gene 113